MHAFNSIVTPTYAKYDFHSTPSRSSSCSDVKY